MIKKRGKVKSEMIQIIDENKCKSRIRPYWVFHQKYAGGGFSTNSGISVIHGISILVDAIDGSVYYYPMTGVY